MATKSARLAPLRRFAVVVALLVLGMGIAPTTAGAAAKPTATGTLTYTCGFNICQLSASGRGKATRLTNNGTKRAPYAFAATSRNGKVTIFTRGGGKTVQLFTKKKGKKAKAQAKAYWGSPIGYTRLNATGTIARWNEFAFTYPGPQINPWQLSLPLKAKKVNGDKDVHYTYSAHVGFGKGGTRLITNDTMSSLQECPASRSAEPRPCGRVVAKLTEGSGRTIGEVSEYTPNGKFLVVATHHTDIKKGSKISVFAVSSGKLVRDLTGWGKFNNPTISPDGKQVAYECGKGICRRAITGKGKQVTVVKKGSYPTWSR